MPRERSLLLIGRFIAASTRHAEHSDLATGILGGSAMKRLASLCTGEKNKYGRDHQYQRTDDQQQYFCSAPPFGGLRRRLIRLIVTHARSALETDGYHELVRRYRQGHKHEVTSQGIPPSELAAELTPLRAPVRGALRKMRMLRR